MSCSHQWQYNEKFFRNVISNADLGRGVRRKQREQFDKFFGIQGRSVQCRASFL